MFINKLLHSIREHPLFSILLCSLIIRIVYLALNYPLWWDSHVYIGISKSIYSGGEIGMWESFRPLLHPLILGFFWRIGFDPVVLGKMLDTIYSLLIIYLTYKITEQVWGKVVAIVSSLILSLSPLFIMFTGLILSDPLSMVFGLAGIYCIVQKRNWWMLCLAGILLGLSFLSRFPQGLWLVAVGVILLIFNAGITQKIKSILAIGLGFILITSPYFIFNYYRYGSALEPLQSGSWIITTATWAYENNWSYYVTDFFLAMPILLFFFVYLYYFAKEKLWKEQEHVLMALLCLLTIAYFLYVPRKEPRYLVTILPFLSMAIAFVLVKIYQQLQSASHPWVKPRAFVVICILLVLIPIPVELHFERAPTFEKEVLQAIDDHHITGTILTSDPALMSYVDLKVVTFDGIEFAPIIYERNREHYQLIFVNECDFICAPEDAQCQEKKRGFLSVINQENTKIFMQEEQGCEYGMWVPR